MASRDFPKVFLEGVLADKDNTALQTVKRTDKTFQFGLVEEYEGIFLFEDGKFYSFRFRQTSEYDLDRGCDPVRPFAHLRGINTIECPEMVVTTIYEKAP